MNSPKISILIPTKNRLEFLKQAVASVAAQGYANLEVIVSDNWSDDGTHEWLMNQTEVGIVMTRPEKPVGMMENWNHALSFATGEYFLLLSDDDELEPDGIQALVHKLDVNNSQAEKNLVVIGMVEVINGKDNVTGYSRIGASVESAKKTVLGFFQGRRSNYPCGNLLQTKAARAFGGYDGRVYGVGADGALWMNLAFACGSVIHSSEVVSRYRAHAANATSTTSITDWVSASAATRLLAESRYSGSILSKIRFESAGRSHTARLVCGLASARSIQTQSPFLRFVADVLPQRKHILSIEGGYWIMRASARLLVYSVQRLFA